MCLKPLAHRTGYFHQILSLGLCISNSDYIVKVPKFHDYLIKKQKRFVSYFFYMCVRSFNRLRYTKRVPNLLELYFYEKVPNYP